MTRVIEVSLTDLEEKISDALSRRTLGMTANQISFFLEGLGFPLSSWQLGRILRDMERLGVISRHRSGHIYRYKYITPTEHKPLTLTQ